MKDAEQFHEDIKSYYSKSGFRYSPLHHERQFFVYWTCAVDLYRVVCVEQLLQLKHKG